MTKESSQKNFFKYININSIRTNLLIEVGKDLNRHKLETKTRINNITIKDFERKYDNYIIELENDYYNNNNNEINYGRRLSHKFSNQNLFKNIIKLKNPEEIEKNKISGLKISNSDKNLYIYDDKFINQLNFKGDFSDKFTLVFNEKDNKRFNISDKKNKKFQKYIENIKKDLNTSNNSTKKGKYSLESNLNDFLTDQKISKNDSYKSNYSTNHLNDIIITNYPRQQKNIENSGYTKRKKSINSENLNLFNTLNNSESNNKDLNRTTRFDKEKTIEKFISKIQNTNMNKFICKEKMNNPLLYRDKKHMKKEIKLQNKKIGFNYLHTLTMKIKKISIEIEKNYCDFKEDEIVPAEIKKSDTKNINCQNNCLISNRIKKIYNKKEFSEKLLNLLNESDKNVAFNNDLLNNNEFSNDYPYSNISNLSNIIKNQESNHLISNFLSYGNLDLITYFINKKFIDNQDSFIKKIEDAECNKLVNDNLNNSNKPKISEKNIRLNKDINFKEELCDFQIYSRKKLLNSFHKKEKNEKHTSGSISSCHKILDYLTDDDLKNVSEILQEKSDNEYSSSLNIERKKKKKKKFINKNLEIDHIHKIKNPVNENFRGNILKIYKRASNKNIVSIDNNDDYSFRINLIPVINEVNEKYFNVNSTISSCLEFETE